MDIQGRCEVVLRRVKEWGSSRILGAVFIDRSFCCELRFHFWKYVLVFKRKNKMTQARLGDQGDLRKLWRGD